MPHDHDVLQILRVFLIQRFPALARHGLEGHQSLTAAGGVDSMGILEIVSFLEEEFRIVLRDDEIVSENFGSLAALAQLVESKRSPLAETAAQ